jgi:hypothetical protein
MQAQGNCREDHVTQGGSYIGDFVDWRRRATGKDSRYGSVTSADQDLAIERVKDPTSYHPPFIISFEEVSESDWKSTSFTLHGISDDSGYKATCNLTVIRRLDHLPTDDERRAWLTPGKP